jgi:serine acetyltransferase/GT2 family glycosyltransferase
MGFALSVVMATYNRQMSLERLLGDLDRQRLPPGTFEVVVVDDGSTPRASTRLRDTPHPYPLHLLEQANAGPAAARHRGVLAATGDLLVFLDDDMRVGETFLSAHLDEHNRHGRAVILGVIRSPRVVVHLPVFERFHLDSLDQTLRAVRAGKAQVQGVNLCTGNVSMRRADYLAVGGFDRSLRESEDRDLGIRLEQARVPFFMSETAGSIHATDHGDLETWLDRSQRYGRNDLRIHVKNSGALGTNPWRFLFMVSPVSRPLLLAMTVRPPLGRSFSRAIMAVAGAVDRTPLTRVALKLTTLAYGVEYFSGLGQESGNSAAALQGLSEEMSAQRRDGAATVKATATFLAAVRADVEAAASHRARYHVGREAAGGASRAMVEQIGLQMMGAIRLMQWLRDTGALRGAKAISRMIRHLYAAEVHWNATFAPGVSIVHGVGLVVSHLARVDHGCILFHNVTLGEGLHPETRERGAPHLEHDVHVGPGCTLLGPITVGAGSKLMAGCVLTHSVPPRSLVSPTSVTVSERKGAPATGAAANHRHHVVA